MIGSRYGKFSLAVLVCLAATLRAQERADLILHGGKVVTVDDDFSIAEALAVRGDRILAVGSDEEILRLRGESTEVMDLRGTFVMPGLMDSHTHPGGASMHEFDHEIPWMESIPDVLEYLEGRARVVPEGEWIVIRQVFITRLREQRYPTRAELDRAAPRHPVMFATGPDASLNSLALQRCGIDRDFEPVRAEHIERDDETGEPTGIVRSHGLYVRDARPWGRTPTEADYLARLQLLLEDYRANGITVVADRNASSGAIRRYEQLRAAGDLPVRVRLSHAVNAGDQRRLEAVVADIERVAEHPLRQPDLDLQIIGIKTFLDGGMLTGSALMREPWGISSIYSISDPQYRGDRKISEDRLAAIVRAAVSHDLQFTAHSVGDGAVHALLDAYRAVSEDRPIRHTRPCITHCNFMSAEAIDSMAELGVVADIQPAWLFLDVRTLRAHFGEERLRYFQPLQSVFQAGVVAGGGSDHMQKIGSIESINPYNPFLGMWITMTRTGADLGAPLHPEEALTREQAIRFYTRNNAHLLFLDDELGSLEPGKLADFVLLDRDLLTCETRDFPFTGVLATYMSGKLVYEHSAE